ncbi:MAG: filamentous hemagglutinin N-terminal domain-containing protein [Pseudomonadota bacterium]
MSNSCWDFRVKLALSSGLIGTLASFAAPAAAQGAPAIMVNTPDLPEVQVGTNINFNDGTNSVTLSQGDAQSAVIDGASTTLTVDLDANAASVIDWNSFNIMDGSMVTFTALGDAAVLNRVTGTPSPSDISGSLLSDAGISVFLLNPNGILIGSTGAVQTGSFVASVLPMGDGAFVSGVNDGRFNFAEATLTSPVSKTAGIDIEAGAQITLRGGDHGLLLVAPRITSEGDIGFSGASTETDQVAFVTAAQATVNYRNNSPLQIIIRKGTRVGSGAQVIGGTVNGRNVYMALASQADVTNALLSVTGQVTTATQSENGIVLSAGEAASNVSYRDTGDANDLGGPSRIEVSAPLQLNSDFEAAALGKIDITGTIDAAAGAMSSDVTLNAGRALTIDAAVGGTGAVDTLTANGSRVLLGADVTTTGAQDYLTDVAVSADTTLESTGAGAISFDARVTAQGTSVAGLTVTTAGDTVFGGAVSKLSTLTTDGGGETRLAGGSVATTGAQVYNDDVRLLADTRIVTGITNDAAAAVTFVGQINGVFDLTVSSGGITAFEGDVGLLSSLTTRGGGRTVFLGSAGLVRTEDEQTYLDEVVVTNDVIMRSTGAGDIRFADLVSGPGALEVDTDGLTRIEGSAGTGADALASLIVRGATRIGGIDAAIVTTGEQSYGGAVEVADDATLTAGGASDVTFSAAVDGRGGLTVNSAGDTRFVRSVGANTPLAFLTTDAAGTTTLGRRSGINPALEVTTRGAIAINDPLSVLVNSTIANLAADPANTISFAAVDGDASLIVNSPNETIFAGAVGANTPLLSLATDARGTVTFSGGQVVTDRTQDYAGGVTLGSNMVFTSRSGASPNADVTFGGAIDGGFALTVESAGATTFGGAVGDMAALTSVTTDAFGTVAINGRGVTTTGAQTYNDIATIGNATNLTSTMGGEIAFDQTLDSAAGENFRLTIGTTGLTRFGGFVGGIGPLQGLTTLLTGAVAIDGGGVTTVREQDYSGPVTLGADAVLTSADGRTINFADTLDSAPGRAIALAINTAGTTQFEGFVGGIDNLLSLTTDAGGSVFVSGGGVTTRGDQIFGDSARIGADAVFTSRFAGIAFADTLNSAPGGPAFDVTTSAPGETLFAAAVGTQGRLGSLVTDRRGTVRFAGDAVRTAQSQTYNNPLTLDNDVTFSSLGMGSPAGDITFAATLNGTVNVTVETAGNTTFDDAVGGTAALASLTTDSPGTVLINGGSVTTIGDQSYGDPAILGTATTLTSTMGGAIAFAGALDSASGRRFPLTINTGGETSFAGLVGGTDVLLSLTTDAPGTVSVTGGGVTTSGAQTYNDAAFIGTEDATFTSNSGAITFASTLDNAASGAAVALNVEARGDTVFADAVGQTRALLSIVTDAPGTVRFGGPSVTTVETQTYNDALILGGDVAFVSDPASGVNEDITFASTVDGAFNMSVSSRGTTTFDGAVGSVTPLASLQTQAGVASTNGPSLVVLNGGSVVTTGDQVYSNRAILGRDTVLTSTSAGAIAFTNDLDSAPDTERSIAVNTDGRTQFGLVGNTTALRSLVTDAGGTTSLNENITVAREQIYGDAVTLARPVELTTLSNSSTVEGIVFQSTVDDDGSGRGALIANTGSTTVFEDEVGGTDPLQRLIVNGGGVVRVEGGVVTTSANQTFADAVELTQETTFTSEDSGAIDFQDTLDGAVDVLLVTGGETRFGGEVGSDTPLTSLTTDNQGTGSDAVAIDGGSVTTTGAQTYAERASLGDDAVLTSTMGGAITFGDNLDGPRGLTVNTSGDTVFEGRVGGGMALADLLTDAPGRTIINGGLVETLGDQIYNDDVQLGDDTTFIGDDGTFAQVLDAQGADGADNDLTLSFAGLVALIGDDVRNVANLLVNGGGKTLLEGTLTTSGDQTWSENVDLTGDTQLVSEGGSITFLAPAIDDTIVAPDPQPSFVVRSPSMDGVDPFALTLEALQGDIDVRSRVELGSGGPLGDFTATAGSVRVADLRAGEVTTTSTAADGETRLGTVNSSASVTVTSAGTTLIEAIDADGMASITSAGSANIGELTAREAVSISGGADTTLGAIRSTESSITVDSVGETTISSLRAATTASVTSGADTTIEELIAEDAVSVTSAGTTRIDEVTSRMADVFVDSGSNTTIGDLNAGGAASVTSGGTTDIEALSAVDAVTITSAGDTDLGDIISSTSSITVDSDGLTRADSLIADGDVTVDSEGTTAIDRLRSGASALVTSGGDTTIGSLTAEGSATIESDGMTGLGSVRAQTEIVIVSAENLSVSEVNTAGMVTLTSGGESRLGLSGESPQIVSRQSSIVIESAQSVRLANLEAQEDVTITAPDLDIEAAASAGASLTSNAGAVSIISTAPGTGEPSELQERGQAPLATIALGADADGALVLSEAEFGRISGGTVTLDAQAGDVVIGALNVENRTGRSDLNILSGGIISFDGPVTASSVGQRRRFNFVAATSDESLSSIVGVVRSEQDVLLDLLRIDLSFSADQIVFGNSALVDFALLDQVDFIALGLEDVTSTQSVSKVDVARELVSNSASALYLGLERPEGLEQAFIRAASLNVSYDDFALFANTATRGLSAGVTLNSLDAEGADALTLTDLGQDGINAFALFGEINGAPDRATAVLGARVLIFDGTEIVVQDSRINGCEIGSGSGCLTTPLAQPALNVFDSSRLQVIQSADQFQVEIDPVVSGTNESLYSGVAPAIEEEREDDDDGQ